MTYAVLKAEIASYLQRDDLTSVIPTFVKNATARFSRVLRVPQMESRDTRSLTSEYTLLPDDFLEIISVKDSDNREMRYLARQQFSTVVAQNARLAVPIFCVEDYQLRVWPAPSVLEPLSVTILYYERLSELASDSDVNWLLGDYPDAYLYGSLMHARMFLSDEAQRGVVKAMYDEAIAEIARSKIAATGIASAVGSEVPTSLSSFDILRGY